MIDEPKAGTLRLTTNAPVRVMVNLDFLRESDSTTEAGANAVTLAIARTLLAEIDRLSARVEELEHGVYPMEERVRSLEIDAAWKEGRQ